MKLKCPITGLAPSSAYHHKRCRCEVCCESWWRYKIQRDYGITGEDYKILLERQGSKCALCGLKASEARRRLDVDHDHKTGKVRGLLCNRCNKRLHAEDALEWYSKAYEYLAASI